jgi:membrane-associated protease RseP (regulator of RpoE activity)
LRWLIFVEQYIAALKSFSVCTAFLAGILLTIASSGWAQTKARVQIRRNINGQQTEEVREFELKEGQDINEILREMGVLDEFDHLKEGQQFSINIDKYGDQNMQLRMQPLMPVLPPMASSPIPGPEEGRGRPYLGIQMKNDSQAAGRKVESGALITDVVPGSPAEAADLRPGDLIIAIQDDEVMNTQSLMETLKSYYSPGDEVKIRYIRDGKRRSCKLELGTRPEESRSQGFQMPETPMIDPRDFNFDFNFDSLLIFTPGDSVTVGHPFIWDQPGMQQSQTAYLGISPFQGQPEKGVKVNVIPNTPAEEMGLESGDIIYSLNGLQMENFDQLAQEIGRMTPGASVALSIDRNGKRKEVEGALGSRTASKNQDFRIFHQDKGLDENGSYNYEYQLDMQPEDMERRMEEMIEELRQKRETLMNELEQFRDGRTSVELTIEILEISPEEAASVNRNADPKLETRRTLEMESFSFFPNPGDGVLKVQFASLTQGPLKVIVYDSNGSKVYLEEQKNFNGTYNNTIDISRQPAGTYYMQIMVGEQAFSKKIVKY